MVRITNQIEINTKPIKESGLSWFELSEENFPDYLNWKFKTEKKDTIEQINRTSKSLLRESLIKSIYDIDKQINKYQYDIVLIWNAVNSVQHKTDKLDLTPTFVVICVIAIEDETFRRSLTIQHIQKVLKSLIK